MIFDFYQLIIFYKYNVVHIVQELTLSEYNLLLDLS